jgi:hypothetical protein
MPCNTITTQSVALAKAMPSIVAHALKTQGWFIREEMETKITASSNFQSIVWTAGKGLTLTGYGDTKSQIKNIIKEYSKQAVTWAAKRAGWNVKQTGQNTLTVSQR